MFRNLLVVMTFVIAGLSSTARVSAQPGQPGAVVEAEPTPAAPITDPASAVEEPAAPVTPAAVPTQAPPTGDPAAQPAPKTGVKPSGDKAEVEPYEFTDQLPGSYWLPLKASGQNDHVDWMFYAILGLSIFCFAAITIAVVYLTWRYRMRPGHRAEPSAAHDNVLEVVWTVIPSIICVFIFIAGWRGYLNMTTAPGDAMDINVIGKQWDWQFNYTAENGDDVQYNELHVPLNRPVRLVMRSDDVIHAMFLPSLRVKQDVLPGRYTYVWFEAAKPGVYKLYCAEYCGNEHSDMKSKIVVHESGGYEAWLQALWEEGQVVCPEKFPPGPELEACYKGQGETIYERKGCKQCHSLDGSSGTGPTFKGMWGEARSFTDGTSGTVDENYIRESVYEPMEKVRSGFNPVMPTFKGKLKDKDIDALNNWMKTL